MMNINFSTLPKSIQKQIPLSLRTYKSEYSLEELPPPIQTLLRDYFDNQTDVEYNIVFDCVPDISEYGDLKTVKTVHSLILEYLKNYFITFPEDYPFDPNFGSKLKKYLHTRDTEFRRTLITTEVQNIVTVISADLNTVITIKDVKIENVDFNSHYEYYITIKVEINNELVSLNINV